MSRQPRLIFLIPTYNEKDNIVPMLTAIHTLIIKFKNYHSHILVVDDNSPDGTGVLAKKFKQTYSNITVLSGPKLGLGIALRKGMIYAINKLKADLIITNDADFQFNPEDIPTMLKTYEQGTDVVIGSRHIPGGGVVGWPIGRVITHWLANYVFAYWIAGIKEVTDHNGNLRIYRVQNTLDKINLSKLPADGYGFLNYIVYELAQHQVKFTEIPVTFRWRQRGETKVSFNPKYAKTFIRDTYEYVKLCLQIRFHRLVV